MRLLLVRHGQAVHNVDESYYKYGNDDLLTLTDRGFKDAETYVDTILTHIENNPTYAGAVEEPGYEGLDVHSSDQTRAVQTASIINYGLIHGPRSSLLMDCLADPDTLHLMRDGSAVETTPRLREFYVDTRGVVSQDPTSHTGEFSYSEYEKDIYYEKGLAVSFYNMVTQRLMPWVRANRVHNFRTHNHLRIGVGHHYSIAAAIASALILTNRGVLTAPQMERVVQICHRTYIHKGLVYDLGHLNPFIGEFNDTVVSSALLAGLVEEGIQEVVHLTESQLACAKKFMTETGLPKRYAPRNRVSNN